MGLYRNIQHFVIYIVKTRLIWTKHYGQIYIQYTYIVGKYKIYLYEL
jgi:hypothetical protein